MSLELSFHGALKLLLTASDAAKAREGSRPFEAALRGTSTLIAGPVSRVSETL
jgi:hypothetical protein